MRGYLLLARLHTLLQWDSTESTEQSNERSRNCISR